MPQPFARAPGAPGNSLLQLNDRSGIVVLCLDGAPPAIAHEILSATVAALHALNIPATMRSTNTKSHLLVGHLGTKSVRSDLLEVELIWELAGPKGVADVSAKLGGILRRAMAAALYRLELSVQPVRRERDLVITGKVSLGPVAAGVQRIEISWSVREWDGEEIGNLKQANMIAAELMDEKWPELAKFTAKEAAPRVVEVLHNIRSTWDA